VSIKINENLPAAGIDLSDMKMVLNNGNVDFDITDEVKVVGDPYDYELRWIPPRL